MVLKQGGDLCGYIKVAYQKENDVRQGIQWMRIFVKSRYLSSFPEKADSMDGESIKAKPFGYSTSFRSLDRFPLPCWTWGCRRRENADFLPLAQELL